MVPTNQCMKELNSSDDASESWSNPKCKMVPWKDVKTIKCAMDAPIANHGSQSCTGPAASLKLEIRLAAEDASSSAKLMRCCKRPLCIDQTVCQ